MADNDRPRNSGDGSRPRRSGDRKPNGKREDRPQRSNGDRKPYGNREDRPQGSAGGTARPARPARDGERPAFSRDSRPARPARDGERPAFSRDSRPARPARDGERPAFSRDSRPPRSDRNDRGDDRATTRGGRPRDERIERQYNNPPPPPRDRVTAPDVREEVTASMLDKAARARLRTLSKDNAEDVGRHLVMAGQYLESDPELAYRYAQVALARGGRVDIVREAAAVTAYATGRYDEALREFRTVRRLNGSSEHLALMADCERGLGRPARALALAAEPEARSLDRYSAAELQIVVAGARADLGDMEAALVTLEAITPAAAEQKARIDASRADVLEALGRQDEAAAVRAQLPVEDFDDAEDDDAEDDVVVYDTAEVALEEDLRNAPVNEETA